jgi:hypothetical protein
MQMAAAKPVMTAKEMRQLKKDEADNGDTATMIIVNRILDEFKHNKKNSIEYDVTDCTESDHE